MSDIRAALLAALDKRPDGVTLPRNPRSTANVNNPLKPEYRRAPREEDPTKWSPPAYRDRDAERVVGRLSPKENR